MVHGPHRKPILATQGQRNAPATNRPEPVTNPELVHECPEENIPTNKEEQ